MFAYFYLVYLLLTTLTALIWLSQFILFSVLLLITLTALIWLSQFILFSVNHIGSINMVFLLCETAGGK